MIRLLPSTEEDWKSGWRFNFKQMQDLQKEAEKNSGYQIDLEIIDELLYILRWKTTETLKGAE